MTRRLSASCGVMIAALAITGAHAWGAEAATHALRPGERAPELERPAARGGPIRLKWLEAGADEQRERRRAVLLSFLDTQAKAEARVSNPSRAQIVHLKSMAEQYALNDLLVVIVDASCLERGKTPSTDALINFTYDWRLDDVPVLTTDEACSPARAFGVTRNPTTFLIRSDGTVDQRWDGLAAPAQLGLALESLVGPPKHRDRADSRARPAR